MISNGFQPLSDEEKDKHGGRGGAICSLGMMMLLFYVLFWILIFPDWTHSAWQLEDNLMGRVKRFNGLFLRCISPKQGAHKCDNYGKPTFVLDSKCFVPFSKMLVDYLSKLLYVANKSNYKYYSQNTGACVSGTLLCAIVNALRRAGSYANGARSEPIRLPKYFWLFFGPEACPGI